MLSPCKRFPNIKKILIRPTDFRIFFMLQRSLYGFLYYFSSGKPCLGGVMSAWVKQQIPGLFKKRYLCI